MPKLGHVGWFPVALLCIYFLAAVANIFDRMFFGSVTDFLYINFGGIFKTGIFNIADLSVTTGMILVILWSFKKKP